MRLLVFILFLSQGEVFSQDSTIYRVMLGYGLESVDKRIEFVKSKYGEDDFQQYYADYNDSHFNQYSISLDYLKISRKNNTFLLRIEYAYLSGKYSRLINSSFTMATGMGRIFNDTYQVSLLGLGLGYYHPVRQNNHWITEVGGSLSHRFALRREVNTTDGRQFPVNAFEFFNSEIMIGVNVRHKRYNLKLHTRLINLKFRDDMLDNNGKDYEFHNPFKLILSIGYAI